MNNLYFDYAAATPLDPKVKLAMEPYWEDKFYNPSAIYLDSIAVKQEINAARKKVAELIGAQHNSIIFTSGATESDNLAINGVMQNFDDANCVVSAIDHDAVLEPAAKHRCKIVNVDKFGFVDLEDLKSKIDDKTVLISIIYANNEIGTVQHMSAIAELINEVRVKRKSDINQLPIYFHTDAAQATNYLDINVDRLGVDLMSLNSGKIYGPKMMGCLYIRPKTQVSGLILGGGQERGIRSGTENAAGIVGFARAMEVARGMRKDETKRLQNLSNSLYKKIQEQIPVAKLNGHAKHRLANNLNILLPGIDGERAVMMLDEDGMQCATGSACSALTDEDSHVLKAIGLSSEEAKASLRITLGRHTTQEDCDKALDMIKKMYQYFA